MYHETKFTSGYFQYLMLLVVAQRGGRAHQEVVVSNPVKCWAFVSFFLLVYHSEGALKQVLKGAATLLIFCQRRLAEQLGANPAQCAQN